MTPRPALTDSGVGLRPWRATDAPALLGATEDREIADWSSFPFHPDLDAVAAWVQRQVDGTNVSLAVVRPGEDVALGYCALNGPDRGPDAVTMGYWLVRDARGQGLMTPAARLLADWGFAHGVATRVTLMIRPGNRPSRAVAERLGAHRVPGEEVALDRRGRQHRMVRYALTP